jgi:hypothetical protein
MRTRETALQKFIRLLIAAESCRRHVDYYDVTDAPETMAEWNRRLRLETQYCTELVEHAAAHRNELVNAFANRPETRRPLKLKKREAIGLKARLARGARKRNK